VSLRPKGPIPESFDNLMEEDPQNQSHQPLHWMSYPAHAVPSPDLHSREPLAVRHHFSLRHVLHTALVARSFREAQRRLLEVVMHFGRRRTRPYQVLQLAVSVIQCGIWPVYAGRTMMEAMEKDSSMLLLRAVAYIGSTSVYFDMTDYN
jgi:hypothetical protein